MTIEVAGARAVGGGGRLGGGDAQAHLSEASERGVVERVVDLRRRAVAGGGVREGREVVTAEVLRDGVRRARGAARAAEDALRASEEALEHVGGRRDARVVEADEEVRAVALEEGRDVIDEATGGGAEPGSRRFGPKSFDVSAEALVRLLAARGEVGSLGGDGDLARDVAKDLRVQRYAPRAPRVVPARSERVPEVLEDAFFPLGLGAAPLSQASVTRDRSSSRRS